MRTNRKLAILSAILGLASLTPAADFSLPGVRVQDFLPEQPISRAGRPALIGVLLENTNSSAVSLTVSLQVPAGVTVQSADMETKVSLLGHERKKVLWRIEAGKPLEGELRLQLRQNAQVTEVASLRMSFLPSVKPQRLAYIPAPEPVQTSVLIGAHNCPLWEAGSKHLWANVLKHPERMPALGLYTQENPEVADWETKWAVEHGVSFFVYCWYRASQGGPVTQKYGSAIHDALFNSKFMNRMKFTIMWENQSRGRAGVADEKDLLTNLLPFWMENYFKHPSYLKINNRPVLFIYRPEFLIKDLGGIPQVTQAFDRMRQACREQGFDGLYILGEYRGLDPRHLQLMKSLGLDYTFAYCWPVPNSPTPTQAVAAQLNYMRKTQELGILPQVVTVSQAWSGWHDEGSIWKIPPHDFENLLQQAKAFLATFPAQELGSQMLLLDNWNEWGEGHYIAPYREYGFGYLDAVRNVFSKNTGPHQDLIPEDIGLSPYDAAYYSTPEKTR